MREEQTLRMTGLKRCPYEKGDTLFLKGSVEIPEGLTVITGCNGSGKSTLLYDIEGKYKANHDWYIVSYREKEDGRGNSMSSYLYMGDYRAIASVFGASEGEAVFRNYANKVYQEIATFRDTKIINKNPEKNALLRYKYVRMDKSKNLLVILDGIDSGVSLDMTIDIKNFLHTILEDLHTRIPEIPVYILVSSNSWEFCEGERCLDARSLKFREFSSYEEYRKYILDSRKKKDHRLETFDKKQKKD